MTARTRTMMLLFHSAGHVMRCFRKQSRSRSLVVLDWWMWHKNRESTLFSQWFTVRRTVWLQPENICFSNKSKDLTFVEEINHNTQHLRLDPTLVSRLCSVYTALYTRNQVWNWESAPSSLPSQLPFWSPHQLQLPHAVPTHSLAASFLRRTLGTRQWSNRSWLPHYTSGGHLWASSVRAFEW